MDEEAREAAMRRIAQGVLDELARLQAHEQVDADTAFGALLSAPVLAMVAGGHSPIDVIAVFIDFIRQATHVYTVKEPIGPAS